MIAVPIQKEFLSEESSAGLLEQLSKIKNLCHFQQKYKAEEEFFIVLKPTEIMFLACILFTYFLYMLYKYLS